MITRQMYVYLLGWLLVSLSSRQILAVTSQPKAEPNTTAEPEPEVQGEGAAEPVTSKGTAEEAVTEPTGEAEVTAEGEPEGKAEVTAEGDPKGEAEVTGEGEPNRKVEVAAEGEPEGTAEGEPTAEPEGRDEGPEPEAETGTAEVFIFVTLYSLIIIIILVGNIMVAMVIVRSPKLRGNSSNLYLLSLVLARASIAVFVIPARITGMFSEAYLGSALCKLCHFAALGSSAASIFSVVSIAISKYIQLTHKDSKMLSMKQSLGIIGIIWVLGFIYAIRAAFMNDLVVVTTPAGSTWSCTVSPDYKHLNKYFIFVDMVCIFLIPLVIILFCYSRVIKGLSVSEKIDKQSFKAIRMLIILMILFTICTMTPMILKLYILWGGMYFNNYSIVETFIYMFSYSNSWFNLVVFAYFRDDLRGEFVKMVSGCCNKNTVHPISVKNAVEETPPEPEKDQALRMMEF